MTRQPHATSSRPSQKPSTASSAPCQATTPSQAGAPMAPIHRPKPCQVPLYLPPPELHRPLQDPRALPPTTAHAATRPPRHRSSYPPLPLLQATPRALHLLVLAHQYTALLALALAPTPA